MEYKLKTNKMGTRSTVRFYNNEPKADEQSIVTIFQMFDGYPSGVGVELATWLKDKKLINGISLGQNIESGYANGMGCLAAQYIKDFKEDIGGLYIQGDHPEFYDYKVYPNNRGTLIQFGVVTVTPEEFITLADDEESLVESAYPETGV